MAVVPAWTDNVTVIASADLSRGAVAVGTIDLRAKFAAELFIRIGRGGTTALTNGIDSLVRRALNANAIAHPGSVWSGRGGIAAAASSTVNATNNAGQKTLTPASTSGFAAGDYILIGGGTAREEWARISTPSGGDLLLDRDLTYTHTAAQADTIRNKAECYDPIWIVGGSIIEVVIDYGDDGSGETARVEVLAQTYDRDESA